MDIRNLSLPTVFDDNEFFQKWGDEAMSKGGGEGLRPLGWENRLSQPKRGGGVSGGRGPLVNHFENTSWTTPLFFASKTAGLHRLLTWGRGIRPPYWVNRLTQLGGGSRDSSQVRSLRDVGVGLLPQHLEVSVPLQNLRRTRFRCISVNFDFVFLFHFTALLCHRTRADGPNHLLFFSQAEGERHVEAISIV